MQNQIHELAKTLPPPRKQNTACDACRTRKVKCNKLPGQEKCQHCLSKNYPCTHFVQQATSEKKRGSANARRPRNLSNTGSRYNPVGSELTSDRPIRASSSTSPQSSKLTLPSDHNGSSVSPPPSSYPPSPYGPSQFLHQQSVNQPISVKATTPQLLAQLFAPPDNRYSNGLLRVSQSPYSDWGDVAVRLQEEAFRVEYVIAFLNIAATLLHCLRCPKVPRLTLSIDSPWT